MDISIFPKVNAGLNGLSTLFLTAGFILIKRGNRDAHRVCMLSAIGTSAVFLASYVTYHFLKDGVHTRIGTDGAVKVIYYVMLITHVILAMAVLPLVFFTLTHALKGRLEKHRAWARITYPIWYYVSVTGVLIYLFLYQWWPA
jgi:putative membrane protein